MVWRAILLGVGCTLSACLQSGLTPCGDNFCPPGKECHEATGGCYGPDQIEACNGLGDFDECMFGNFIGYCLDGICLSPRCGDGFMQPEINETCDDGLDNSDAPDAHCRTNCLLGRCGDGVVDPSRGEVCDDGNADTGDSCAPDCGSDQTCGNGILDQNEECDDGNKVARDGCSLCKKERLAVEQITTSPPRTRLRAAMAFDPVRQRTVLFGGRSNVGGFRHDTLEFDGARWRESKPLTSPSGREAAAMVYDGSRHRIVLFGGNDGAFKDDLWEWDGANWIDRSPATGRPPARAGHAMVFDPVRRNVIVFGGRASDNTLLGDTWAWNGSAWTELAPTLSPPPTEHVQLAFDPRRGYAVMFGGNTATGKVNTTWLWDGTDWQNPAVASPPIARDDANMLFDTSRGHVVMLAGKSGTNNYRTDIAEWDGAAWLPQTPNFPFYFGDGPSMAYDTTRRLLVAISSITSTESTFVRRDSSPSFVSPFAGLITPSPRDHAAAAYDPTQGRIVMFGGWFSQSFSPVPTETWEWDGSRWSMTPISDPNFKPRYRPALTYSNHDGIVLTGATDNLDAADLWKWNGATKVWTQIAPGNPLLGFKWAAGFTYDSVRDRLILYGSAFDVPDAEANTFEWDGAWTPAPASAGGRHNFGMVYDPVRQRTLAVGGHNSSQMAMQAFEYDGAAWASISEPGGQLARGSSLIFDPVRRQPVYLFDPEDTGVQIWSYDGSKWDQQSPQPPINPLYRPAIAYDALHSEILMFGGRQGATGSPDTGSTVVIRYQPNVPVEACTTAAIDYDNDGKLGCDDPDCAARCTPTCLPGTTCAIPSSTCGDGTCNAPLEDCLLCPDDCGICPVGDCGDFRCDAGEDATTCPGDCS